MRALLIKHDSNLTPNQWDAVKATFQHCKLPLFVKILYEEVCKWKSYDEISVDKLPLSVDACINIMFDRMEKNFGVVFISRSVGYITLARNGLSEAELEDILSIDDDVLSDLFQFWNPPIRRLPASMLQRLRNDLKGYLVERDDKGTTVLAWFHGAFAVTIRERYLKDGDLVNKMNGILADYFMGTWSGDKEKPFVFNERLAKRLGLEDINGKALRFVPDQPIMFGGSYSEKRYNLRKMTQLPHSLAQTDQILSLRKEVFYNLKWISSKIKATSLQEMLWDYAIVEDNKESSLVVDALRMSESALERDVDSICSELTGRLLPHFSKYTNIRELIRQCDKHVKEYSPFVTCCQLYSTPGGPMQYEIVVDGSKQQRVDVHIFKTSHRNLMTINLSDTKHIDIWDLTLDEPLPDIDVSAAVIYPSSDGRLLGVVRLMNSMALYKTDSGELKAEVNLISGAIDVQDVAVGENYFIITLKGETGPFIIDMQSASLVKRLELQCTAVFVAKDEKYMICNNGCEVISYKLPEIERMFTFVASESPESIFFPNMTSPKCFILTKSKSVESIKFDASKEQSSFDVHLSNAEIRKCVPSHQGKHILVRATRCLYLLNSLNGTHSNRFQELPVEIFKETMSRFTGAIFSSDDSLVIATRYRYTMVWNTNSGELVRLLNASDTNIGLFSAGSLNKFVTVTADQRVQIWNIDNIESQAVHSNELCQSAISVVRVLVDREKIICGSHGSNELKIVDMFLGNMERELIHDAGSDAGIVDIILSPNREYFISVAIDKNGMDTTKDITHKPGDRCSFVVWDAIKFSRLFSIESCIYAVFDNVSETVVFIEKSIGSELSIKVYEIKGGLTHKIAFAEGKYEIMNHPVLLTSGDRRVLATLVSMNVNSTKAAKDGVRLYLKNVKSRTESATLLKLEDIVSSSDWSIGPECGLLDVQSLDKSDLLIVYGKNSEPNKNIVSTSEDIQKGAVVFSEVSRRCKVHIPDFLKNNSITSSIQVSYDRDTVLDDKLQVFDTTEGTPKFRLSVEPKLYFPGMTRLVLNGDYLVGLSMNKRHLLLSSLKDGVKAGSLNVHGVGTCIDVGSDQRTVAVGCKDGRVLVVGIIIDLEEPYDTYIKYFNSRRIQYERNVLDGDLSFVLGKPVDHDKILSMVEKDRKSNLKRGGSYSAKAATNSTVLATKSRACVLQ